MERKLLKHVIRVTNRLKFSENLFLMVIVKVPAVHIRDAMNIFYSNIDPESSSGPLNGCRSPGFSSGLSNCSSSK